ncbi:hypothetical protein ACFORL_12190 [Legionella dresdenensis]|uniref:Lipoprotein n=1 Tax=Legionella dresdenensis TaxID=450200 RepID=A0ABV8CIK1_9GAMM
MKIIKLLPLTIPFFLAGCAAMDDLFEDSPARASTYDYRTHHNDNTPAASSVQNKSAPAAVSKKQDTTVMEPGHSNVSTTPKPAASTATPVAPTVAPAIPGMAPTVGQ